MVEPVNAAEFVSQPGKRSPDQFEFIKLRLNAAVARITLSRPDHNLLNEAMLREIAEAIAFAGEREQVKLIVLDSACKVFCGGIDIGEYTSQRVFQMLDAFHAAFSGMLETGKPVICVVNGPAIGGGAELAAFGDLVVATPKARFAQPEITIGVFPPLASAILPFLVGPKTALEIILTGEAITAERALELGLVTRLVPEAQLEQTVNDLIARISAQSGPVLSMAKKNHSRRHGPLAARRSKTIHEHFSPRTLPPRGFPGRPSRPRREAQTRLEKPLVLHALPSLQRALTLLARAAYTHLSILQARAAGKAVRIGRGPATVIG